jgi:hypothetical protein
MKKICRFHKFKLNLETWLGLEIHDPEKITPDPGGKKRLDPGSATLSLCKKAGWMFGEQGVPEAHLRLIVYF